MEKLYTAKEVAELLSMAEGTIRNKLWKGEINGVKVGGAIRIPESEVKKMIVPINKEE